MLRALCLLLLIVSAGSQSSSSFSPAEQGIIAREHQLNQAWLRHDAATVARLYAADFSGVTRKGRPIGRADILNAVAHNDEGSTEASEERVRLLGEAAIYTAVIADHGTRPATKQPYTVRARVIDVWARRHGEWQLVASQETEIPQQIGAQALWKTSSIGSTSPASNNR